MINVNEYFDGKVKSLAINSGRLPATIGVMQSGNYTFKTEQKEIMSIVQGELKVLLPNEGSERTFSNGQVFEIPGSASFEVIAVVDTAYFCQYCD